MRWLAGLSGVRGGREGAVTEYGNVRLMRCVVEWKEVSSRLMWVRVKIERENFLVYIGIWTGY